MNQSFSLKKFLRTLTMNIKHCALSALSFGRYWKQNDREPPKIWKCCTKVSFASYVRIWNEWNFWPPGVLVQLKVFEKLVVLVVNLKTLLFVPFAFILVRNLSQIESFEENLMFARCFSVIFIIKRRPVRKKIVHRTRTRTE